MKAPIVVMSFNRPDFLRPTLESLKAQVEDSLEGREIHLFQDGSVNKYSGIRYAKDEQIDQCVEVFRSMFPNGVVHRSERNIGICENFMRAEKFVFETLGADCGYFFEDDLILSPNYVRMLDQIHDWADARDDVAYFSAYGNHYASRADILAERTSLINLDHQWAFGLLRRHWLQMQSLLKPFYDIVVGEDYSRRHHRAIFALYAAQGASPRASSQDAAKAFACDRLGLWRCNTMETFARYIGSVGQHMTTELFAKMGFDKAVIAEAPIKLRPPGSNAIETRVNEQRKIFEAIHRNELDDIMRNLSPKTLNPLRLCADEDVIHGYRLFLNREPESPQVIKDRVGRLNVTRFVLQLVSSKEYQDDPTRHGKRPCTREDVVYAYRLCLHRDPEGEGRIAANVGLADAFTLAQDVWHAPERLTLWNSIEGY